MSGRPDPFSSPRRLSEDRSAGPADPAGPAGAAREPGDVGGGAEVPGRGSGAAGWGRTGVPGVDAPHPGADTQGPGGGATGPVEAAAADILDDVAALTVERDEYLGALQRLQADFENFRKRVQRQQQEQSERAAQDLVGKLLPVLDTLDLAEDHLGAGEDGGVTDEGKALSQSRAMLIDAAGEGGAGAGGPARDRLRPGGARRGGPRAPADDADGAPTETVVDEVLRSGYRWRGHVLRPAMVRVRG